MGKLRKQIKNTQRDKKVTKLLILIDTHTYTYTNECVYMYKNTSTHIYMWNSKKHRNEKSFRKNKSITDIFIITIGIK